MVLLARRSPEDLAQTLLSLLCRYHVLGETMAGAAAAEVSATATAVAAAAERKRSQQQQSGEEEAVPAATAAESAEAMEAAVADTIPSSEKGSCAGGSETGARSDDNKSMSCSDKLSCPGGVASCDLGAGSPSSSRSPSAARSLDGSATGAPNGEPEELPDLDEGGVQGSSGSPSATGRGEPRQQQATPIAGAELPLATLQTPSSTLYHQRYHYHRRHRQRDRDGRRYPHLCSHPPQQYLCITVSVVVPLVVVVIPHPLSPVPVPITASLCYPRHPPLSPFPVSVPTSVFCRHSYCQHHPQHHKTKRFISTLSSVCKKARLTSGSQ